MAARRPLAGPPDVPHAGLGAGLADARVEGEASQPSPWVQKHSGPRAEQVLRVAAEFGVGSGHSDLHAELPAVGDRELVGRGQHPERSMRHSPGQPVCLEAGAMAGTPDADHTYNGP